ncbi:AraC-type DNA-binding protein [Sporobacter termitidis DSM 10068]|uniref:AraC-type DNA-binding protein n=1 Tax=Sporobacter termitidis DSM 10068 TaxID=1123282 RepID=A0A1M5W5R7_9FIRM|nr:AraC family transcriptional regulator [Sporobacter termitidis]SHH82533.1 AraC-type DNA-binding protein [Sporobacter termitidis DSM 10068]
MSAYIQERSPYNWEGVCFAMHDERCSAEYWMYPCGDLFTISVTNILYRKDTTLTFQQPDDYVGVFYYDSVEGVDEETQLPIAVGRVAGHIGTGQPYTATYRGNVPIRGVAINIMPEYCDRVLASKFPGGYRRLKDAFSCLNDNPEIPELLLVLRQIQNCRAEGPAAALYYESKVNEALSIILTKSGEPKRPRVSLPADDREKLFQMEAYIHSHYAEELPLAHLASIACMSVSKLKYSFQSAYGCPVSEYITEIRMRQAQHLLENGVDNVAQIAGKVGYLRPSSFTKAFKERVGVLPKDYRKSTSGPR